MDLVWPRRGELSSLDRAFKISQFKFFIILVKIVV